MGKIEKSNKFQKRHKRDLDRSTEMELQRRRPSPKHTRLMRELDEEYFRVKGLK